MLQKQKLHDVNKKEIHGIQWKIPRSTNFALHLENLGVFCDIIVGILNRSFSNMFAFSLPVLPRVIHLSKI